MRPQLENFYFKEGQLGDIEQMTPGAIDVRTFVT